MPGLHDIVNRTVLPVYEYASSRLGSGLIIETDASGNQTLAVKSPPGVRQTVRDVLVFLAENEVARQTFLNGLADLVDAEGSEDSGTVELMADDMADELLRGSESDGIAAKLRLPAHIKASIGLDA